MIVTERYAHLRLDLFPMADLGLIALDLGPGTVLGLRSAAAPVTMLQGTAKNAKNPAIGH